ncbi:uncharacterized protein LOC135109969 isoform X2 [Scylla paramamosain]|uniref:uncharacterized protein LOC135109969 isoform X2 n=1 Tax=Scylla paramamosain TaxID=85552 RepID=UPI0030829906
MIFDQLRHLGASLDWDSWDMDAARDWPVCLSVHPRKIWTPVSPLASPFASLGWPGQGRGETMPDLARFYATTLKTSHGILLWVAQVVMPGLDLTGRLSFETVLLHGLQGDGGGHKTSKSWGSVINPPGCHQWGVPGGTVREGGGDPECRRSTHWSRMNSPTGIPECGADALWSTLCSTSFRSQCGIDICG